MRQRYDWIIVDTPPILSVADTRLLMPLSDGVVLVIDAALSSRHLVRQTRLALEAAGTSILGVIINKSPFAGPAYYHSGAGRQVTGTGAISAPRPSGE
jgi:Mrp family chromosome partitioning ATPase